MDTDEGQTLLTGRQIERDCLVWTRTYTPPDPAPPAPVTLRADMKDIMAREAQTGAVEVASVTKSMIFAQSALAGLPGGLSGLSKKWKVKIGEIELDIVSVQDAYAPGLYSRILATERT